MKRYMSLILLGLLSTAQIATADEAAQDNDKSDDNSFGKIEIRYGLNESNSSVKELLDNIKETNKELKEVIKLTKNLLSFLDQNEKPIDFVENSNNENIIKDLKEEPSEETLEASLKELTHSIKLTELSLSDHQKQKIVEAISKFGDAAKTADNLFKKSEELSDKLNQELDLIFEEKSNFMFFLPIISTILLFIVLITLIMFYFFMNIVRKVPADFKEATSNLKYIADKYGKS